MTKAELVDRVVLKLALKRVDACQIVDMLFELMKSTLETGEHIKISGFGSFEVRDKSDRHGRNPQTGRPIIIESRRVVSFKSSPLLKRYINKSMFKNDADTQL